MKLEIMNLILIIHKNLLIIYKLMKFLKKIFQTKYQIQL
jgi:hypothetical protein